MKLYTNDEKNGFLQVAKNVPLFSNSRKPAFITGFTVHTNHVNLCTYTGKKITMVIV